MPIFKIHNQTLAEIEEKRFDLEKNLQKLTEQNLGEIFGLEFISGMLNKQLNIQNFVLDTLAFDTETKSFIIIEYKRDKSYSVIDQGYNYLALMLKYKADFILEYNEQKGTNLKRSDIDWSQSRVIFIAPSFTPHQKGAIAFRDLPIELWEVKLYKDNLILYNNIKPAEIAESIDKITKSATVKSINKEVKTYTIQNHLSRASEEIQDLFAKLEHEIFELDTRVIEKPVSSYIGFKIRYHNFCSVNIAKRKLRVYTRASVIKDPAKKFKKVPAKWGWGTTALWYWDIDKEKDIDYAMTVIRQGYEVAPDK